MAFQTPITIYEIICDIHSKKYLLPSIQRGFEWNMEQIKMLFDSLMRDYPINTFLFWKVPKEKVSHFKFYEFLREYHQRNNKYNQKADIIANDDIIAVLDGQQRLTSLYIALNDYKRKHFIPDTDLSFANFYCFFKQRESLLIEKLRKELCIL